MRERIRLSTPLRDVRVVERPTDRSTFDVVLAAERERAFAAGVDAGRVAERQEAAGRLDQAVERVVELENAAGTELARVSVELALTIARTILKSELEDGGHDIEAMVRETLAEADTGRQPCVVHLNPTDYARLADASFRSGTTIQADDGVPTGDVHVETALGLLVREAFGAIEDVERRLRAEVR